MVHDNAVSIWVSVSLYNILHFYENNIIWKNKSSMSQNWHVPTQIVISNSQRVRLNKNNFYKQGFGTNNTRFEKVSAHTKG